MAAQVQASVVPAARAAPLPFLHDAQDESPEFVRAVTLIRAIDAGGNFSGELFGPEFLGGLHVLARITSDVAHRDSAVLGHVLHDLHVLLAPLLGERRDSHRSGHNSAAPQRIFGAMTRGSWTSPLNRRGR